MNKKARPGSVTNPTPGFKSLKAGDLGNHVTRGNIPIVTPGAAAAHEELPLERGVYATVASATLSEIAERLTDTPTAKGILPLENTHGIILSRYEIGAAQRAVNNDGRTLSGYEQTLDKLAAAFRDTAGLFLLSKAVVFSNPYRPAYESSMLGYELCPVGRPANQTTALRARLTRPLRDMVRQAGIANDPENVASVLQRQRLVLPVAQLDVSAHPASIPMELRQGSALFGGQLALGGIIVHTPATPVPYA